MAPLGNRLRTAEIDIDCVAVVLSEQGSFQQHLRIVAAELYDERSILGTRLQRVLAILRVLAEAAAVEHGRVAQLGTVAATQQTPRQLAGIHHGGHHILRRAQRFLVKLKSCQLWPLLPTLLFTSPPPREAPERAEAEGAEQDVASGTCATDVPPVLLLQISLLSVSIATAGAGSAAAAAAASGVDDKVDRTGGERLLSSTTSWLMVTIIIYCSGGACRL